jgi:phospholipid-binding lipoprotein MlaA
VRIRRRLVCLALVCLALGGTPARAAVGADPLFDEDESMVAGTSPSDPLERENRAMLRVNLSIGDWVLDPLSRAYAWALPAPARRAIRRALANLDAPAVLANDILQGSPVEAGTTAIRFILNSSVGVAGLWDPATAMDFPGHDNDFGLTLGIYGLASGPYLVIPVLGPTTVRGAFGAIVDFAFRPTTYLFTPGVSLIVNGIQNGTLGFTTYAAHADALQALEESSIDFYAALRSAYLQDAAARLRARRDAPFRVVRLWQDGDDDSAGGAGSSAASGRQIGDLRLHHADQRVEAAAVQH